MLDIRKRYFSLEEVKDKNGVVEIIGRSSHGGKDDFRKANTYNFYFDEPSLSKRHASLCIKLLQPILNDVPIVDQFRIFITDLRSSYGIVDLNSNQKSSEVIDLNNGESFGLVILNENDTNYPKFCKLKCTILIFQDPLSEYYICQVEMEDMINSVEDPDLVMIENDDEYLSKIKDHGNYKQGQNIEDYSELKWSDIGEMDSVFNGSNLSSYENINNVDSDSSLKMSDSSDFSTSYENIKSISENYESINEPDARNDYKIYQDNEKKRKVYKVDIETMNHSQNNLQKISSNSQINHKSKIGTIGNDIEKNQEQRDLTQGAANKLFGLYLEHDNELLNEDYYKQKKYRISKVVNKKQLLVSVFVGLVIGAIGTLFLLIAVANR